MNVSSYYCCLLFFLTTQCHVVWSNISNIDSIVSLYRNSSNDTLALALCEDLLLLNPNEYAAHHLKGLLLLRSNKPSEALGSMLKASSLRPSSASDITNTGIVLHTLHRYQEAITAFKSALALSPNFTNALWNLGRTYEASSQLPDAINTYYELGDYDSDAYIYVGNLLGRLNEVAKADEAFSKVSVNSSAALLGRGVMNQRLGYYDTALLFYKKALTFDNCDNHTALTNIGTIYQELGDFETAASYYESVLESSNGTHGAAIQNLGTLHVTLGISPAVGVGLLNRIITEYKDNSDIVAQAFANLGVYYMEEGEIRQASTYFKANYEITGNDGMRVRIAKLLPPVVASIEERKELRSNLQKAVEEILQDNSVVVHNPVLDMERPAFYLAYHGENDYDLQVLIAEMERHVCPTLAYESPALNSCSKSLIGQKRKTRIGFVSKFFTANHPHLLLLQGVINHLALDFDVTVFIIPKTGENVDLSAFRYDNITIIQMSLNLDHCTSVIESASIDVLVYSDTMSEPISHFLAHRRLAPVQAAFWGNPVTSGIPTIDYFISGEYLEEENERNDLHEPKQLYSETLIKLPGLGIWYDKIKLPTGKQHEFDFGKDAVIYMTLQSVFKLMPEFDNVLLHVLQQVPKSHIVLLEGRREAWTQVFKARLARIMKTEILNRIHFVPRVAGSNAYLSLLEAADVVLHPFPFGGSKTSADAIALGLPLVTLEGKYLKSRMASAFFRHMNVLDTVANSVEEYLRIAVALGRNSSFRHSVSASIKASSHLIFEDLEVINGWKDFIKTSLAASLNDQGANCFAKKAYDVALSLFKQSKELNSTPICVNNIAVTLGSLGRVQEAYEYYELAISDESGDDELLYNYLNTMLKQGLYAQVIERFFSTMGIIVKDKLSFVALGLLENVNCSTKLSNDDDCNALRNFKHLKSLNVVGQAFQHHTDTKREWQSLASTVYKDFVKPIKTNFTEKIHLILQYFISESRQGEIDECLLRNINNPDIALVHLLVESTDVVQFLLERKHFNMTKVVIRVINERLSFHTAFTYANNIINSDDNIIVILANADVYFENLNTLKFNDSKEMLALTRWEKQEDGEIVFFPRVDSQDAWIFYNPSISDNIIASSDFTLGTVRSDNRIAAIFKDAGYVVKNPSLIIKAVHVHKETTRDYSNHSVITGKGIFIPIITNHYLP